MSLGDLREALGQHYGLNNEVRDWSVIKHYRNQTIEGSKPKTVHVYVDHPRKAIPTREVLLMGGHSLVVQMNKREKRGVNCSCDSAIMEHIMNETRKQ